MLVTMIAIGFTFYATTFTILDKTNNEILDNPKIMEVPSSDPLAKKFILHAEIEKIIND